MPTPPEPQLDAQELAAFRRGVAQFNAGLYFECHDTIEDVWSGVRGPARDFFQGLIQVAVGRYHWSRGNTAGALSLFGRARKRLEAYGDRYWGFDLAAQRAALLDWCERLARDEAPPEPPPRWRFDWDPGPDGAA